MQDRALRLDFFIAIAALLVSAASALALIYQTRVIGAQFAATIWPYLTVTENYNNRQQQIVLANDGMGPALIRSAHLEIDGRSVQAWTDYMARLSADTNGAVPRPGPSMGFTAQGVGTGTTLRPGASLTLFTASFSRAVANSAIAAMLEHRLVLRFCYCSLNGSCWSMRASSSGPVSTQVPVHGCGSPAIIAAAKS
jgi:hypothetical protein